MLAVVGPRWRETDGVNLHVLDRLADKQLADFLDVAQPVRVVVEVIDQDPLQLEVLVDEAWLCVIIRTPWSNEESQQGLLFLHYLRSSWRSLLSRTTRLLLCQDALVV